MFRFSILMNEHLNLCDGHGLDLAGVPDVGTPAQVYQRSASDPAKHYFKLITTQL